MRAEVDAVYRRLGGRLPEFPLNLRSWDICVGNVAVELDEERHFNRYRRTTLDLALYTLLPRFPLDDYRSYCSHEDACLRSASYGKHWSSPSTEKQFSLGSPEGELKSHGSPRWKQRAFYDFVKDLAPAFLHINLARISIWDRILVNGVSTLVGEALPRPSTDMVPRLVELIEVRSGASIAGKH